MADVVLTQEERKVVVDGLIANSEGGCCWQESDREVLNGFSDITLAKLTKQQELAMNAGMPEELQEDEGDDVAVKEEATKKNNAQADGKVAPVGELNPTQTRNQRVETPVNNGLTDQDRADLAFARRYRMNMRQRQIDVITANSKNKFSKKALEGMPDNVLQNMAQLATQDAVEQPLPSYFGAQGASQQVTTNTDEDEAEEPLPIPTINYKELADENRGKSR